MRRALVVLVSVAFQVVIWTGGASAAPGPTPNGWIGACNMVSAWPGLSPGVGVQPGGGMERAMTVDNPNGNDGMFRAVSVSGNGIC